MSLDQIVRNGPLIVEDIIFRRAIMLLKEERSMKTSKFYIEWCFLLVAFKDFVIESQSLHSTVTFNNTFIAIFFTLLGSVFGIMQTVRSVMSFVESSSKK
jgi:hypothetical protein